MPTEPSLPFDQLREQVRNAAGGAIDLAVGSIAQDLGRAVGELLGLASLPLQQLKVLELGDTQLRLTGIARVPVGQRRNRTVDIAVEARFSADGSGIGYALAFAVTSNAVEALLGDLGKVVKGLPVKMERLWLTLSSAALRDARIDIPGHELAKVMIDQGRGYLFRLASKLLKALRLDQTIFYLIDFPQSLRFETRADIRIPVGPLLDFSIARIVLNGPDSITLIGKGQFDFFRQKLAFTGDLTLSSGGIAFEIPIDAFVAPFDKALLKQISFGRTHATFDGTLAGYAVGVRGDFTVAGSGNAGSFLVKYASGSASIIPDLFELESSKLTISDLLTLTAGARIAVPALDRVLVFEKTYLYYANRAGLKTLSGVPSVIGTRGHSDLSLLGHKGYAEVNAVADGKSGGRFMLAPVSLGGIDIQGKGQGSPSGYAGTRIGARAILLEIDSDSRSASGALEVRFFGRAAVGCAATLSENAIDFDLAVDLPRPLGPITFGGALAHQEISLKTAIDMAVDVEAEWNIGRFRIAKAAQVKGKVSVVARPGGATGSADLQAKLGPVSVPFSLSFEPAKIDELPEMIRRKAAEEIKKALRDKVAWLKAVLEGAIQTLRRPERLPESIGQALEHEFGKSVDQSAVLLKQAGYDLGKAYKVLQTGQGMPIKGSLDVLCGPAVWSEREIIDWLKSVCKDAKPHFVAAKVADMLLLAGMAPARVIQEVESMVKDVKLVAEVLGYLGKEADVIAGYLKSAGKSATEAAELIGRAYVVVTRDELQKSLTKAGYAAAEAAAATDHTFRVVENLRNEVGRAWEKYGPKCSVSW